MDCRVIEHEDGATCLAPGNDDVNNRSRGAPKRPSFVDHVSISVTMRGELFFTTVATPDPEKRLATSDRTNEARLLAMTRRG
jgi:hypothetical protein